MVMWRAALGISIYGFLFYCEWRDSYWVTRWLIAC